MTFIRPPVSPFLWMSDPQKAFSFRGLCPPPWLGALPLDPVGALPQAPVIGSRSALAMVRAPPLFCPSLCLCIPKPTIHALLGADGHPKITLYYNMVSLALLFICEKFQQEKWCHTSLRWLRVNSSFVRLFISSMLAPITIPSTKSSSNFNRLSSATSTAVIVCSCISGSAVVTQLKPDMGQSHFFAITIILQLHLMQGVYKFKRTNFQEISRRDFKRNPGHVCIAYVPNLLDLMEHVMMSSNQRSSLCYSTDCNISLMTRNQCSRSLNSRRFPGFPGGFSNSSRFPGFPGVVDTLHNYLVIL